MTYPIKPEEFWNLEIQQPLEFKYTRNRCRRISKIDEIWWECWWSYRTWMALNHQGIIIFFCKKQNKSHQFHRGEPEQHLTGYSTLIAE
jgi:hypothetical protein